MSNQGLAARIALMPANPNGAGLKTGNADQEYTECAGCGWTVSPGDPVYSDADGCGVLHAECCGPEPESFTDADGEPLKAGDPIPAPWTY